MSGTKDNKKPWACRLLPVPTVEEVSSPVDSYPEEDETPLAMGTNCLCVMQETGRHCSSGPKGMAQLPTVSRYCLLAIVSHCSVLAMGAISFRDMCSLSAPHPASKTLRSGNCNAGCISLSPDRRGWPRFFAGGFFDGDLALIGRTVSRS